MKTVYLDYAAASLRNALHKMPGRNFSVQKARKDIVPGIRLVSNLFSTGRLTIDPDGGKPLLDELASYSWDDGRQDMPLMKDDHHVDALRYANHGNRVSRRPCSEHRTTQRTIMALQSINDIGPGKNTEPEQ